MFKVPEKYRVQRYGGDEQNGVFEIPISGRTTLYCQASNGMGWEHVSVHAVSKKQNRMPTWSEMCKIKDLFWEDEDCAMQYHPPRSEYVNTYKYCLHLWRPIGVEVIRPPKILV